MSTIQKQKPLRQILLDALTEQSVLTPKSLTRGQLKAKVQALRGDMPKIDRQIAGRLSELQRDGKVKQSKQELAHKHQDRWALVTDAKNL